MGRELSGWLHALDAAAGEARGGDGRRGEARGGGDHFGLHKSTAGRVRGQTDKLNVFHTFR